MKVVLDTNVFVSGIFFGGPPAIILDAWQDGRIDLAVSLEILTEYERVANELAARYPGVDPAPGSVRQDAHIELGPAWQGGCNSGAA